VMGSGIGLGSSVAAWGPPTKGIAWPPRWPVPPTGGLGGKQEPGCRGRGIAAAAACRFADPLRRPRRSPRQTHGRGSWAAWILTVALLVVWARR
jgi:hypothetical protein